LLFEEIEEVGENLNSGITKVEDEGEPVKEDVTAKIVTVGDILCERPIYEDAYDSEKKEYDFSHMFSNIEKHTLNSDITLRIIRN
jgi:uncharacterized protein YabE (DUF348 family)